MKGGKTMAEEEYLNIADFAEIAGVSKQAVYKRLDKDLAPFCKIVDGKKVISAAAAELFNPVTVNGQEQKKDFERTNKDSFNYLLLQLSEKDKIIEEQRITIKEQQEQIKQLQDHIITQSTATTEILKKQSQLQENFQILLARQQTAIESHASVSTASTVEQPVEQPVESTAEQPGKKSWFSKFFNK